MEISEILSIIGTVLVSMGGAAAIIIAASKWIGGIWADRQLAQYQNQLEISRSILLRYTGEQFSLYNKLWRSLYKLKKEGDKLWNAANKNNLKNFSKQLKKTNDKVEMNYLLLEERHYQELMEIIEYLKNYNFGKARLIEARGNKIDLIDEEQIQELIEENGNIKERYEQLLYNLREDFRRQIRGENDAVNRQEVE